MSQTRTTDTLDFVILTDTHFTPKGQELYGVDPRERLDAAIRVINRDHPEIAFVLIPGDLTNWGTPAEYENLAEALSALRAPFVLMMGNHDLRAGFREVFKDGDDDGDGFVQALRVFPQASLITLDTLDENDATGAGALCERRLGFLERALTDAPNDRPLLLAQHHPASATGLQNMDSIRLKSADQEWAAFERAGRRPDFMLHGHDHRPIFGTWRGVPFHIQRAIGHQLAFDLVTSDDFPGTLETPDYAYVRVGPEGVVIHHRPFLYDGPVYSLLDKDAIEGRFGTV